jgi:hypothetical protein
VDAQILLQDGTWDWAEVTGLGGAAGIVRQARQGRSGWTMVQAGC